MSTKIAIQRANFINETLSKLSYYDQLIWIKDNCPKQLSIMIKRRKYLYDYVIQNTPKLCDNKNDISYCVYWILNPILSKNNIYKCKQCNKQLTYKNYINIFSGFTEFCSCKCAAKNNNTREKCKNTCIKKYNVTNPNKTQEIRDKIEKTKLLRYNDKNWNNREKAIKTEKEKCMSNPNYFKEKYEKTKQTKIKNGHSPTWNNREKYKQTYAKQHNGIMHNFSDPVIIEKRKQTWKEKYGVNHISQCHNIRVKQKAKYYYNDIYFDTAPELAYYIWLTDNNISFTYQPNIVFKYKLANKLHLYFPDFLVDNKIVEIKGDHFFKKDGTMQNPFNHMQDDLYEAKHQCMLENNVYIMRSDEYVKYILYVNDKYGASYLKSFKR